MEIRLITRAPMKGGHYRTSYDVKTIEWIMSQPNMIEPKEL